MSINKFDRLCADSKLYFRSAALFKDSFEGTFPKPVGPPRGPVQPNASYSSIEEMDEDIELIGAELERVRFQANVRPITYVNCWTMKSHECVAMWEIYLGGLPGIAIRSTFNRLCAAFESADSDIFAGKVRYIDHLSTDRLKMAKKLNPCKLKFEPYSYEQELRLLCGPYNQASLPDFDAHPPGITVEVDLTKLIESVVTAPG
jgi:hypothetical protein